MFCQNSNASGQAVQLRLPASTTVPHYLLPVAYNSTTVLVFPAAVKPVDRGNKDLLAQKQPGTDNVLKLKAARKDFPPTNLHVFTADGKLYAFDVYYTDSLASTHDLRELTMSDTTASGPHVLLANEPLNVDQIQTFASQMRTLPSRHHGPSDYKAQMKLKLDRVGLAGSVMFLDFRFANHSDVDYNLDFIRLYIRDKQKMKRTSVQEKELLPLYEDSTQIIPGNSSASKILALPAFTLAEGKEFIVETGEKNAGRSLRLYVHNKTLLRAVKL
jgi:conjugative transposon TraN protein